MNISKKIVASLLGVSLLVAPGMVSGQTVAELQAQIAALMAQINALQAQIAALGGAPAAAACTFTKNLFVGVRGDDVKCLQNYLIGAGHAIPAGATGYFGSQTKAAVAAWQAANGVAPAAGYFGPISRAKYSSLMAAAPTTPTPGVTTPGAEGSITAKYATTPITGEDVFANSTGVGIVGVEVKASGSDVKVDRLDVNFTSRPWLNVAKIHVYDGTTLVKTQDVTSANTLEITVGSSYTVRVDGLSVVVPKDTTKTLHVKIDPLLQPGESTTTVTYKVLANAVRGTDGASIQQYAPSAALADRTFKVKSSDKAELEVSADPTNPDKERNVVVSTAVTTTDIPLLVMKIKSKTNASVIRSINVSATAPANTVLKLYDGATLLKSVDADAVDTGAGDKFAELDIPIAKDASKTLAVKADVPKQSTVDGTMSSTISVQAASNTVVAEDATTFTSANVTGSKVTGGKTRMFDKVPSLALSSASITRVKPPNQASNTQWADFKIRLNATAVGGDIYFPSGTTATAVNTPLHASGSSPGGLVPGDFSLTNYIISSDASRQSSGTYLVSSGETKYIEVAGRIENASTSSYQVRGILTLIRWGITDGAGARTSQSWGLDAFVTDHVILEAKN
jgi:peptidoglycan hydrolase-like protein with peptidoglycan-binding domain